MMIHYDTMSRHIYQCVYPSEPIEAVIARCIFFIYLLYLPTPGSICLSRSVYLSLSIYLSIDQTIAGINKKTSTLNYFTSSDPHHDMLGGGCQVRVVIENMMGRMENLKTLISGFLGLVILVRWALVTMFLS